MSNGDNYTIVSKGEVGHAKSLVYDASASAGSFTTYPQWVPNTTKKKIVTTVHEYDSEGRVIKTTVTEETVDEGGNYRYPYIWNAPQYTFPVYC